MQQHKNSVITDSAWRDRRRLLNPCFATRILLGNVSIFNKVTQTTVQRLKSTAESEDQFDIQPLMEDLAFDMIFREYFGDYYDQITQPFLLPGTNLKTDTNFQKNAHPGIIDMLHKYF